MASYLYRCGACGPWEVHRPIGTADPTNTCPGCGATGRRQYTSPSLRRTPGAAAAARMREEASGDAPVVTSSVPRAAARPVVRDRRWSALPRP